MPKLLRHWFGFSTPVGRADYLGTGLVLGAGKYAIDAWVLHAISGRWYTPFEYLNPLFSERLGLIPDSEHWVLLALAAWTLPFIWVGYSMTLRRALDAGVPTGLAMLWFVPLLNYALIALLGALPRRERVPAIPVASPMLAFLSNAAVALAVGLIVFFALFALCVAQIGYGTTLFLAAPFLSGLASSYCLNRGYERSIGATLGHALVLIAMAAGALLLFALEGAICIAMYTPLGGTLAVMGALFGRWLARAAGRPMVDLSLALLAAPGALALDLARPEPEPVEILTAIEVDAPRELVWNHVVAFTELPEPETWLFRTGVAYPLRATIDGRGVGAVRRCEFTTGAFVEPITAWEEPSRLAFDVAEQPPCMEEWSFYAHIHPPHLDDGLLSKRGEFRLVELPDGRTRLEGRTWYVLRLHPHWYWTPWAEAILHRIHLRVLAHVKVLAEGEKRP
jgi:uncharacterized membrane protein YhaH (DUF805 family)